MKDLLTKFEAVRDPTRTAHFFGIEEIIDPRDTRPLACEVSLEPGRVLWCADRIRGSQWIVHAYEYRLPPRLAAKQASAEVARTKYKL